MNHPVLNFGYKIECNGKSIFFTGDNEPLRSDDDLDAVYRQLQQYSAVSGMPQYAVAYEVLEIEL